MTSVGIAIVSYNTSALLRDCLASLQECTLATSTVVVDNGSHDDSVAVAQSFAGVAVLALGENIGFAAGTNRAIAHLLLLQPPPDFVLLLNPDTVVQPGAIETLVAFLLAHPRCGAVGPRLLNPDGTRQSAAFRFPTLSMTALDLFPPGEALPGRLYNSWWHGRYPQEAGDMPFPIDHPLGACILTRPEVLYDVGLLDAGFFMYAEEVEWCYRMRRAGWSIWQQPAAQVIHVGGASTRQVRAAMLVALYQSRLRFFRMAYPRPTVALHRLIIRAGMLRARALAWRDFFCKRIDREQLRERMRAYTTIGKL